MTRVSPYKSIGKDNTYNATNATDLMKAANLDWQVSLNKVYAAGTYDTIEIPDRFATVKVDKDGSESVLSVVGSRYKVIQNSEIFGVLDTLVDNGNVKYGSAGSLANGKVVWAVLHLPDEIRVGNDEHNAYLLARTSHDGTRPFELTPMINRIGCTNQINALMFNAMKNGLYYSARHSTNSIISVDDIRQLFNITKKDIETYVQVSSWLHGINFNDNDFKQLIKQVYPMSSIIENTNDDLLSVGQRRSKNATLLNRDKAMYVWNGGTGTQDGIAGTKFAAFQTIVEVSDWFSRNDDKQAEKIVMGKDTTIKSRALSLLGVH